MNIIKIYGGLGNQMFQYAFGKAIEMNGIQVAYNYEDFNGSNTVPRYFRLGNFNTKVVRSTFLQQPIVHETPLYRYNPNYLSRDGVNYIGYWQHKSYVDKVLPILYNEFKVRKQYYTEKYIQYKEQILGSESIAIHIRRGDYLTKGHHLLPMEYYNKALSQISGKLFVFSDDPIWSKEHFKGAIFVDEIDYLSFELMRLCKHKIVANSTFSWWASLLGEKDGGKIFVPRRWRLKDEEEFVITEEKLIPDNWIKQDYDCKKSTFIRE